MGRGAATLLLLAAAARGDDELDLSANIEEQHESDDLDGLEKENKELVERLAMLEDRLKEEEQFTYIVTRGFISGAETIYSETMEVVQAKQWCNSNAECKGFSFLGGESLGDPEDEVTVTFKGAPEAGEKFKVAEDQAYVSYMKESSSKAFGALGGAGMQLQGGESLIASFLTSQSIALVFVLALLCFVVGRRQLMRSTGRRSELPI